MTAVAARARFEASDVGRQMPADVDLERDVLSQMINWGEVVPKFRAAGLKPDDFWLPEHGSIYATMLALDERGAVVDEIVLRQELRDSGLLDKYGQAQY